MAGVSDTTGNPLLDESGLPYGLPAFAQISDEHYRPAIEQAMAEQLDAVEKIVANPEPARFANTLVPLELSGVRLTRVYGTFYNATAADTNDTLDQLDAELAPKIAAHRDAIMLSSELYERVKAVQSAGEKLDAESSYLIERYMTRFRLAGAGLDEADKQRLKELNSRLAELQASFRIKLQADSNDLAILIENPAELDGLTAGELSAAAEGAASRGHEGKHLISLVLPTAHPYLSSLTDADVRERLSAAQTARGSRGNDNDTRAVLLEVIELRTQVAELLGFPNYAALVTADSMAKTPEAVGELVSRIAKGAAVGVVAEQEKLEANAGRPLAPSDWPFYAERVRASEYDVDLAGLRPYFEAERVLRDGVFYAAKQLFGLQISERGDLTGYHPDVRVFEVKEEDGAPVGLYLLDLYARESKRGGAWMSSYVDAAALTGFDTAVVVNVLNVPKPAGAQATLLTFDETNTLFHEFGHALHGLLAKATYPSMAGTEVFTDFVELPSQLYESWVLWPEILKNYAVHHQTGEPLPDRLADRLRAAEAFNQGYSTTENLAAVSIDLAWHAFEPGEAPTDPEEIAAFEQSVLEQAGLANPVVPPRYRSPYFAHAFSFGYSASYYSYTWADTLVADTAEWFATGGGTLREKGEQYRQHVIGFGGTRDPLAAYVEWRGRPAPVEPLLKRRGLLQ